MHLKPTLSTSKEDKLIDNNIYVTRPYLPDRKTLNKYIDSIYNSKYLTNSGPLVGELENKLKTYLRVKNVVVVANGSIALQLLYKSLELKGEVITTPFSFIATASTIKWLGLTPVFADVDGNSLNIDPNKIEAQITPNTSAIVATHIFGNPCDIEKIESIAKKHNLKVIYDGAHSFGVQNSGANIYSFGDATALSFHATKIFSTVEGGAIVTDNDNLAKKLRHMINFGINNQGDIVTLGINAKMNELEAAFGLSMLPDIDKIIAKRKIIYQIYTKELSELVEIQSFETDIQRNYIYSPFIFNSADTVKLIIQALNRKGIYPKQYFFPALSSLDFLNKNHDNPIASSIAERILCLPSYYELNEDDIYSICNIIKRCVL